MSFRVRRGRGRGVSADVAGGTLTFGGTGTVINQGTLEAKNGATLSLNGTWSNTGAISVTNSTVNLGGSFTGAELGTLTRTGGSVNLVGLLTGNLSLDATTGWWNLKGGTLKNGTLSESGGALLVGTTSGGALAGVTVAGDLDLSQQSGVFLTVENGLVLDGTMLLGNAGGSTYGYVYFGDSSAVARTFSGNANVLMGGNTNNALYNYNSGSGAAGTLTVAPSVNVHGKSGVLNNIYGTGTIINQGTIAADVAGGTLTFGGTGTVSNQGTLEAKTGATLTLSGTWSNAGTISVTNSTVNLGGSFTGAGLGTVTRTGGSINLVGVVTGNLSLDATTGSSP